ncbi:MAG: D-aminoacylase [Bacillota bacterium]
MARFIIQNAAVVDGTGAPARVGNVAVADGFIVEEASLPPQSCDFLVDAAGLACTPGFIDTHSHSDIQVLLDPNVYPKIRQGITTEILGQDGVSAAPLPMEYLNAWRKNQSGLNGDSSALAWDWKDTKGYLERIEKGKGSATNIAYLVPHGNVRMSVMGLENRLATKDEIDQMCRLLDKELQDGGIGLSSGLIYVPCAYSNLEELTALCRVAAAHNKPFVVHQRSEADDVMESMDEILSAAKASGVHAHFSHFKICGMRNLHYRRQMADLLDQAAAEGLSVSFDQYPYTAGSTTMTALLPPWAQSGGAEELLGRLADPSIREKITRDIQNGIHGWDDFMSFSGPSRIRITSVQTDRNQHLLGHTVEEIAAERGVTPFDAIYDLLIEESLSVSISTEFGTDEDIAFFMRRPEQNVCTDGLFGAKPHPRVYGTFARILEKYVRQDKVLTLEEAVYKMTGKPAGVFAMHDRGVIAPGRRADLLVFDADRVQDHATYVDPQRYPTGFHVIFVNGVPVFEQGKSLNNHPGMVIRQ